MVVTVATIRPASSGTGAVIRAGGPRRAAWAQLQVADLLAT